MSSTKGAMITSCTARVVTADPEVLDWEFPEAHFHRQLFDDDATFGTIAATGCGGTVICLTLRNRRSVQCMLLLAFMER